MRTSRGFTVIELIIAIALIALAGAVFFNQKQTLEAESRDLQRKTAINTIDYALREVYFPKHGAYPRVVNQQTLQVVEPGHFKDPAGRDISQPNSDYRYEPAQCQGDKCQAYQLRTVLEREADFVKDSQIN